MRRWAPRLFSVALLLILGAVLGHAAEHDGWFKGVFHCHATEDCHGDADTAPCEGAACHSHDEVAIDAAPASVPSSVLDAARAAPDSGLIERIPALSPSFEFRLPDPPPPLPGESVWLAGWFPLLA